MENIFNNNDHAFERGIVFKKNKGTYDVYSGERKIACSLSNRLWKEWNGAGTHKNQAPQGKSAEHDPIAVGDQVRFTIITAETGTIIEILPRQNKLSRQTAVPMPGAHPFEQVIVANVGLVVPVFAASNPPPRWNLLDRYLVTAESRGLPVLISITKLDLAQGETGAVDAELMAIVEEYRRIGYPVNLSSASTGEGIDELRQALSGNIAVFLGKSGVGKTSLLNALQPGLGQRVNEVSQKTGKGKHTTTALEMFPLEIGGAIVDTPGVREFGLWEIDEEDIALFFPEMRPFVGRCRFGMGCQHDEEPGCAVRKAVMAGQISPRRYQSYMHMKQGD